MVERSDRSRSITALRHPVLTGKLWLTSLHIDRQTRRLDQAERILNLPQAPQLLKKQAQAELQNIKTRLFDLQQHQKTLSLQRGQEQSAK